MSNSLLGLRWLLALVGFSCLVAFRTGATWVWIEGENPAVFACRRSNDAETILAVHNLSDTLQPVKIKLPKVVGGFHDLTGERVFKPGCLLRFTLEPYEYVWIDCS